jgi:adenylyltransferase/sulfurtransferase
LIDYDQFCGFPSGSKSTGDQGDSGAEDGKWEITVDDLEGALKDPQHGIRTLDVRNAEERDICLIDGVDWIPLDQLQIRASELNASQRTYIHCKSGVRSLKAVRLLRDLGFNDVWSVRGGILEWIEKKAPDLPVY